MLARQNEGTNCIFKRSTKKNRDRLFRDVLNLEYLAWLRALPLLLALVFSGQNHANQNDKLERINVLYQSLLTDYVTIDEKNGLPANMMDYAGIKADERLPRLLKAIQGYPKSLLDTNDKKIAFYLNAYNILAAAKVSEHWPLFKLRSLGNYFKPVWTHPAGEVCGDKMTLRILEHEILRKLDEPRIHFALNCASVSCPDLRKEPYEAIKLEQQLSEQTKIFLTQKGKGMTIKGDELTLSPIFNWFSEDFEPEGGVLAFIKPFLPEADHSWKIEGYFDYDWAVNDHLSGAERTKIKRSGGTWFN